MLSRRILEKEKNSPNSANQGIKREEEKGEREKRSIHILAHRPSPLTISQRITHIFRCPNSLPRRDLELNLQNPPRISLKLGHRFCYIHVEWQMYKCTVLKPSPERKENAGKEDPLIFLSPIFFSHIRTRTCAFEDTMLHQPTPNVLFFASWRET
jgi:hypothetical protein